MTGSIAQFQRGVGVVRTASVGLPRARCGRVAAVGPSSEGNGRWGVGDESSHGVDSLQGARRRLERSIGLAHARPSADGDRPDLPLHSSTSSTMQERLDDARLIEDWHHRQWRKLCKGDGDDAHA